MLPEIFKFENVQNVMQIKRLMTLYIQPNITSSIKNKMPQWRDFVR